jgi:hypothetical protein
MISSQSGDDMGIGRGMFISRRRRGGGVRRGEERRGEERGGEERRGDLSA